MRKEDKHRIMWAVGYLVVAFLIILIYNKQIFYLDSNKSTYDFFRFLWCIVSSFLGFFAVACKIAFDGKSSSPNLRYATYYPLLLIAISCISFSALSIFRTTSGYIFYYASFAVCFILAFRVDYFTEIVLRFLPKRDE
jgi:hypothetical protein